MPTVSVISRTCRRMPLLRRCYDVLKNAAVDGLEWIVVDDEMGGSAEVSQFVDAVGAFPVKLVVSGAENRSVAANAGLALATGTYVHFLDDDDCIAPTFYHRTLEFLARESRFGGVATLAEQVVERVGPDGTWVTVYRNKYHPELRSVSLARFAVAQLFAPVSFVARRECVERIGRFDEELEVCEDYDFYLRFLSEYDIGVLAETLCSFHQREPTNSGVYAMTNSSSSLQHEVEDAQFRNRLLRRDLQSGRAGLGWLLALGELSRGDRRLNLLFETLSRRSVFRSLLSRFRT